MKGRFFFATVALWISFLGFAFPPHSPPDIVAEVTSVIDGETIEVRLLKVPEKYSPALRAGQTVRVRYIAVDAPGLDQEAGKRAAELNRLLVENREVYIELDVNWWDQQNQLLAYVYLDQHGYLMVNMMLIASTAVKVAVQENQRYKGVFEALSLSAMLADASKKSEYLKGLCSLLLPQFQFSPQPFQQFVFSTEQLELKILSVTHSSPIFGPGPSNITVRIKTTPRAECKIRLTISVYERARNPSDDADNPAPRVSPLYSRLIWLDAVLKYRVEKELWTQIAGPDGIVTWSWEEEFYGLIRININVVATLGSQTKTAETFYSFWR